MITAAGPAGPEVIQVDPTVRPGVTIAGRPISTEVAGRLDRVVVDNDMNLPGMFELTLLDFDGTTLGLAGVTMGAVVEISGGMASTAGTPGAGGVGGRLIVGEVTAIEGILSGQRRVTVVRGYTAAHRLQRARRTRTFANSTDSDIATQIATQARLPLGTVDPTTTIHAYLAQVNQTDWEFLKSRAEEIGYETGVADGQFYFRRTVGAGVLAPVTLTFLENLMSFRPRVTAANLTPDVEVRVWDPLQMQAFAATATVAAGGAVSPATLAGQFGEGGALTADVSQLSPAGAGVAAMTSGLAGIDSAVPGLAAAGAPLGTLGPPPSPTAHVVNDRPLATAADIVTAGQAAATALGSDLSGTWAEAEGDAVGNPGIQPGAMVRISGAQYPFGGDWLVSRARHVFADAEHGYRTTFAAHGRQDRSMLGLTAGANAKRRYRGTIDGVMCGVVSNVLDPLGRARIKVTLPCLSPEFETDWAPVGQSYAGQTAGSLFLPSVGDEVLVAFEYGDPRRPYVLGSLVSNQTAFSLLAGGPAAAMSAIAGGLGGMAGQLAGAAGSLESLAGDVAQLTVAGQIMSATGMGPPSMTGGQIGNIGTDTLNLAGSAYQLSTPGQLAGAVGAPAPPGLGGSASGGGMGGIGSPAGGAALGGLGAVQQSPGMVGEVIRRGYVSSTGNVLVFDDQPAMAAGASGGVGTVGPATGGLGATGAAPGGAGPALASSITLGAQGGNHGLYVDQVAATVILQSNATPGVSMSQMPLLVITAGATGSVIINAGTDVTIASDKTLTMMAPEVMIAGETITVVGELIPITPG